MIERLQIRDVAGSLVNLEREERFVSAFLTFTPKSEPELARTRDALRGTCGRIAGHLVGLRDECKPALSGSTISQVDRLVSRLRDFDEDRDDYAPICSLVNASRNSLIDDLSQHFFLYIRVENRNLFESSDLFGDAVASACPDAGKDIASAGRCLALDEWTACVFHCMRVLEHGLWRMADAMGVTVDRARENWKNIIDKIEKEIRRLETDRGTIGIKEKISAYSSAAIQFRYFKDAFRNEVSHSREHYDERQARAVFQHVDNFMRAVAKL